MDTVWIRRRRAQGSPDMRAIFPVAAVVVWLVVSSQPAPHAQESPIVAAMRDELKRAMADLRLKDEPAPYYIDYEIDDVSTTRIIARLGALLDDTVSRSRTLYVDVRVGDYAFDSSRFVIQGRGGGGGDGSASATLDDDYDVMRRQIWLATDSAYKRAVSVFARKKAAFQNRTGGDSLCTSRRLPAFTSDQLRESKLSEHMAAVASST